MARIVIAPDSFKGSLPAHLVAQAIAEGWREVRPDDELILLPMADGGEGTLKAIALAHPSAVWHRDIVTGPHGQPVEAAWLMLSDSTAVLEIAQTSGLPLMEALDPVGATTRGLGELIGIALDAGAKSMIIGLGGSATTDAGLGVLEGLGAVITRHPDRPGVTGVEAIDTTSMRKIPLGMITLLTDTIVTMRDAPAVFGPQKGASPADVAVLTEAFDHLVALADDASAHLQPGSGAAGGSAWGLMTHCGATMQPGAAALAQLIGLPEAISTADFVITGEGRFDETSLSGKVCGHVYEVSCAAGVRGVFIVGSSEDRSVVEWPIWDLTGASTPASEAIAFAREYLRQAAGQVAGRC